MSDFIFHSFSPSWDLRGYIDIYHFIHSGDLPFKHTAKAGPKSALLFFLSGEATFFSDKNFSIPFEIVPYSVRVCRTLGPILS